MSKRLMTLILVGSLLQAGVAGADVEKKETIRKTVAVDREGTVIVDNIWGSITVESHPGDEVEMVARITIRADSKKHLQRAEDEVWLDITEEDGDVEFYVDGPFRCHDEGHRGRGSCERHYIVSFDFDLKVPRGASVELYTVNDGEIEVRGVEGDFDVKNINGGIEMSGLRGSGRAYALNGDVTLEFDENPSADCRFGSLNGEVRIYMRRGLSADFHLKTFNGEVFTDFPVDYLPLISSMEEEKKGRTTCRTIHTVSAVRAGNGGPVIELDGFNGDMFILEGS